MDELCRPCGSLGQHTIGRQHIVHQAEPLRLRAVQGLARQDQVFRPRRADQSGEPLCTAGTGDHAQQDLRQTDTRTAGTHPPVGCQCQFTTTAEGVSGDRGDHRFRNVRHGRERRLEPFGMYQHVTVRHAGHLPDVRACGEPVRSAPQHDGRDVLTFGGLVGGDVQLRLCRRVQRVRRWPVQPDHADAVRHVQLHAHSSPPLTSSTCPFT
jgi:hypothetical protein